MKPNFLGHRIHWAIAFWGAIGASPVDASLDFIPEVDSSSQSIGEATGVFEGGKAHVVYVAYPSPTAPVGSAGTVRVATFEGGSWRGRAIADVDVLFPILDSAAAGGGAGVLVVQAEGWVFHDLTNEASSPSTVRPGARGSTEGFLTFDESTGRPHVIYRTNLGIQVSHQDASGNWSTDVLVPAPDEGFYRLRDAEVSGGSAHILAVLRTESETAGGDRVLNEQLTYFAVGLGEGSSVTALPIENNASLFDDRISLAFVAVLTIDRDNGFPTVAYWDQINGVVRAGSYGPTGWQLEVIDQVVAASANSAFPTIADAPRRAPLLSYDRSSTDERVIVELVRGGARTVHEEVLQITNSASIDVDPQGNPLLLGIVPGAANPAFLLPNDIRDPENDGFTVLEEEASIDGVLSPSNGHPGPVFSIVQSGGLRYPAITVLQNTGGTTVSGGRYLAGDILYSVEVSDSLGEWRGGDTNIVLDSAFSIAGRGRIATYRSAISTSTSPSQYLRVRVERVP